MDEAYNMGTLFRRSNGVYYGVFSANRKRVWRSTEKRSLEEARTVYEKQSMNFISWKKLTILGFRQHMIELLRTRLSKRTILLYDQALRKLAEILGDVNLRSITAHDIEDFLAQRSSQVSKVKVNIDLRSLRAAFNRAASYRFIESNPFKHIKCLRVPERIPRVLDHREFARLISTIDNSDLRRLVILAVCTGMRLGEIVGLRWEDVDNERGLIRLKHREASPIKTGKERIIPLNQMALAAIGDRQGISDYVFVGRMGSRKSPGWVSRRFKYYLRKGGLPEELHFHSLRHTAASWMIEEGIPLVHVKEILGHSSISTTMLYAHTSVDHLKKSVAKIDDLFARDIFRNSQHSPSPEADLPDSSKSNPPW